MSDTVNIDSSSDSPATKERVLALRVFVVAILMSKDNGSKTNLRLILRHTEAVSLNEAIGMAHEDATTRRPNHQITLTTSLEIKPKEES